MERVYLHGKWQTERRRNPSMIYGNHSTSKQAYAAVEQVLEKYFNEIRRQDNSRQDWFWDEDMVDGVIHRLPVPELPSVYDYRPL